MIIIYFNPYFTFVQPPKLLFGVQSATTFKLDFCPQKRIFELIDRLYRMLYIS